MSATPGFAATPKAYATFISAADSNRTSPSAYGTLVTGTSAGINVPAVMIKARDSTTAGQIMFFMYDGSQHYLIHEETVSAVQPAAGTASFETTWVPDLPINVPTGWQLRVTTLSANPFSITAPSAGEQ